MCCEYKLPKNDHNNNEPVEEYIIEFSKQTIGAQNFASIFSFCAWPLQALILFPSFHETTRGRTGNLRQGATQYIRIQIL